MKEYTIDEKTNSVKPEYRLTYGHSLIGCTDIARVPSMLAKVFSFRNPVRSSSCSVDSLPKDQTGHFSQFHDENRSLCAIVPIESGVAIFGPDLWYLKLDRWMKMSSRFGLNVAVVTKASSSTTIARCNSRGLFSGLVGMNPESLHMPTMPRSS